MKIVAFQRHPGEVFARPLRIDLIADSAVVPCGKPLFLPDFTDEWCAELCVAFRISRLGKGIARKFSPRYYDAMTLVLKMVPAVMYAGLQDGTFPQGMTGVFDNCAAMGHWIDLPEDGAPVRIECCDVVLETNLGALGIDEAVSALSSLATLKMGDVVIPCRVPVSFIPAPGKVVSASVGGNNVLDVRVC